MDDPLTIAKAVYLAMIPFLAGGGSALGAAALKKVGEHGGEALWATLSAWWRDDDEFLSIAEHAKNAPQEETLQLEFIEAVAARLRSDPGKARELTERLGGARGIFEMIGGAESKFINAKMEGRRGAEMRMEGGDGSDFSGAIQKQD